jgi:hypothetical protein
LGEKNDEAGIGKVVYSVDEEKKEATPGAQEEARAARAEVEEADAESFPASDPPSFAGGKEPADG